MKLLSADELMMVTGGEMLYITYNNGHPVYWNTETREFYFPNGLAARGPTFEQIVAWFTPRD